MVMPLVINIKLFWGDITIIFIFMLNKRKCKNAAGATGEPTSTPLAVTGWVRPLPTYEIVVRSSEILVRP